MASNNLGGRRIERKDFAIDPGFPYSAGYQLRILRSEIENNDSFVMIAQKQSVSSWKIVASNNFGQDLEVLDYTFQTRELKPSLLRNID